MNEIDRATLIDYMQKHEYLGFGINDTGNPYVGFAINAKATYFIIDTDEIEYDFIDNLNSNFKG